MNGSEDMLLAPRKVFGRYEIREELGAGSMGVVYLARDTQLERDVAIKILSDSLNHDKDAHLYLKQEALIVASLNDPNILTIYEIGQSDETHFLVTEFIRGKTLRQLIDERKFEIKEAIEISLQIANALKAAHSRGIVHGDLKPENIMLRDDGLVKVLDFGLARICFALSPANEMKTITGTPAYMSPEQIQNRMPIDERSDLWSMGVIFFEMLTGRRPFTKHNLSETFRAILVDEPPSLGEFINDVPLELEGILRCALEKDRDERFQSAQEFLVALKKVEQSIEPANEADISIDETTQSETVSKVENNWIDWFRQKRKWFLLFSGITFFIALFAGVYFQPQGNKRLLVVLLLGLAIVLCLAYVALRFTKTYFDYSQPKSLAFRGLLPFQEADRDRFYGREIETLALFERVADRESRFGVLYGDSGCGKTSLVRAGLMPKLWEGGFVPFFVRSYKDPLAAVLEECRKRAPLDSGQDKVEFLRRVCRELDAPLVIICDQFEEFFVNFKTKDERESFVSFISDCHNDINLPIKFLVSMRSDFLYLINSEFADRIDEPLLSSKLFHLRNFNQSEAEKIIEKSARRARLPFEEGFSKQVARDLAENDEVLPSELQIVGERLQSRRIFKAQDYKRAGGKEQLVHSFLEDVTRSSGDVESAHLILRSLISDENTRLTLTTDEIAHRTQRSSETVGKILRLFIAARLIAEIQDEEPWRYELQHEYLIEKINQITGKTMNATQRANRLLRQYVSAHSVDKQTRIPITKLFFINRYSDIERGQRERELMKKSLRGGLLKTSVLLVLLFIVLTVLTATFSIREDWTAIRLSDGHTAAVRRVVLSPDNRLLVSCGEDNKVIVWDFARRERIATLADHTDWVNWLDFSSDGKFFAAASNDKTVIVWDAKSLKPYIVLREHPEPVNYVGFSPDAKWMVSASGDVKSGRAIIWNVDDWKKKHEIPENLVWGNYLFTPDSRRIMRPDGRTYDLETGEQLTGEFDEPYQATYGAISPNGSLIVGNFGDVMFVKMPDRKGLSREKAHQFHGREVAFSPDGRIAATASEDIILWDTAARSKLFRFNYTTEVWGLAFSRDGRWLVSSYNDGAILLWDMKDRKRAAGFNEHSASVRSAAFSPDGERLASASEDQSIILWNAKTGNKESVLLGHETRVTGVVFSPDGNWLVSTDQSGYVIRWDIARRQPVWTFQWLGATGFPVALYTLSISQNGRWIATTAGINDSADGHQVIDFYKNKVSGIYGATFTADNSRLALISESGTISIFDTQTWQIAEEVKADGTKLICGSYSPDGKWLVTGEDEGNVRLWQTNPLRQIAIVGQHKARIKSVAFSPDGNEVVSSGDDQTIALWDVRKRKLITNLGTHTAPVLSVAFSPDGKRVASGGQDNSVRIFTRKRSLWGYQWD